MQHACDPLPLLYADAGFWFDSFCTHASLPIADLGMGWYVRVTRIRSYTTHDRTSLPVVRKDTYWGAVGVLSRRRSYGCVPMTLVLTHADMLPCWHASILMGSRPVLPSAVVWSSWLHRKCSGHVLCIKAVAVLGVVS